MIIFRNLTILIFLLCWSVTSLADNLTLAEKEQLIVANIDEPSISALSTIGVLDETASTWLVPGSHVIILGNLINKDQALDEQISAIQAIQQLAQENNASFTLIKGPNEYQLASQSEWINALPHQVQWLEYSFAHAGLYLDNEKPDKRSEPTGEQHLPMFYQGNQICHPYFETSRLRKSLEQLNVKTLWVARAENTLSAPWQIRLSDQLNMLDKGVVSKISANGNVQVVVNGEQIESVPAADRFPANPVGLTDEEIVEILNEGEIIKTEAIPVGITKPIKVRLRHKGREVDAIFKSVDNSPNAHRGGWKAKIVVADRYGFEVAAYHLDRQLKIGLVPAAVVREIDGVPGAMQIWYDGLTSKLKYNKELKILYGGQCNRRAQREMMHVFDYLIRNEDRNQSNILSNKSDWQTWFIDHSRAFGVENSRHKSQKKSNFRVTPEFRKAIEGLDRKELYKMRPWLHKRQIKAIQVRARNLLRDKY